ncbi:glutamate--cysteine ligase catalytic subunit-like [Lineus longissimus]|uniref:glutamate--cysteine ligase catalytic subunit-like n=1 Tax=Lineus longissimus TaxID=88925 RepID=UPI002B4E1FD3
MASLSWDKICEYKEEAKRIGVEQFIRAFKRCEYQTNKTFKWGDEIEYMLVKIDHQEHTAKLHLKATDVIPKLKEHEDSATDAGLWCYEYGTHMVESCPLEPFTAFENFGDSLVGVEASMRRRRTLLNSICKDEDGTCLTLSNYPRMGAANSTEPPSIPIPALSQFLPEAIELRSNLRYKAIGRHVQERSGKKYALYVPIYKDVNTTAPDNGTKSDPDDYRILMDAMGFGAGCSALQCTMQATNVTEAKVMFDQLTAFAPVMLALSAACPIWRGYLSDIDGRYEVFSEAMDDRTDIERGNGHGAEHAQLKSRYGGVDLYISTQGHYYNDQNLKTPEALLTKLKNAGIDHAFAMHVAHAFSRDPLYLATHPSQQDDEKSTYHYDAINSTIWKTIRFKQPCPITNAGWRVEFRPIEVQLTDFENAAYCVFMVLLTKTILHHRLNLLIPMSKVDENLRNAAKRDAVREQTFSFRNNIEGKEEPFTNGSINGGTDYFRERSIDYIINGSGGGGFPGLAQYIHDFIATLALDNQTHEQVTNYVKFIQERASGKLMTIARWQRHFVTSHPDYKQDSIVIEKIQYDLLNKCDLISRGKLRCPELHGSFL